MCCGEITEPEPSPCAPHGQGRTGRRRALRNILRLKRTFPGFKEARGFEGRNATDLQSWEAEQVPQGSCPQREGGCLSPKGRRALSPKGRDLCPQREEGSLSPKGRGSLSPKGRGALFPPPSSEWPDDPSGPPPQLGAPRRGGMRLPEALQLPGLPWHSWWGRGDSQDPQSLPRDTQEIQPQPIQGQGHHGARPCPPWGWCGLRPFPRGEPPEVGSHQSSGSAFLSPPQNASKRICSQEGAVVICSVSHILPGLLF